MAAAFTPSVESRYLFFSSLTMDIVELDVVVGKKQGRRKEEGKFKSFSISHERMSSRAGTTGNTLY